MSRRRDQGGLGKTKSTASGRGSREPNGRELGSPGGEGLLLPGTAAEIPVRPGHEEHREGGLVLFLGQQSSQAPSLPS